MHADSRRSFLLSTAALAGAAALGCRSAVPAAPAGPGSAAAAADVTARFLAAVQSGDEARVRAMLGERPALVDATDAAGRSALVLAYLGGRAGVAAALLEHGPALGLVEAAMIPDWERAEVLARADPALLDAWHPVGGTALYAAARVGREKLWKLHFLGADPDGNPRGPDGVTPAYGALEHPPFGEAWIVLTTLLSNGASVRAPQRGGDSLLHVAARRGEPELVRYLLRRGADPEARDARGETALDHAERAGRAAAAALLRGHAEVARDDDRLRRAFDASGAPVVWPDMSDVPASLQASVAGSSHQKFAAVREAVERDARLTFSISPQLELAVEACGHVGNREIMAYHLDHGAPMSLCTSLSFGDLARARALLAFHPACIHERGPHDFAAMWYASIGGGSVEAAELLLDHGAPVDQEACGTTALHWAASSGQRDLAVFLVERGADLEAVGYKFGPQGLTPRQSAAEAGDDGMVRLLGDLGAA